MNTKQLIKVLKMEKIKRYGLPILTAWAWRQVGNVLLLAALVATAAITIGAKP